MVEHSFTVTVVEGDSGINIQVSGIQPFEGVDSKALELTKALRLAMLHDTNRLADCIAAAQHQHIHPETKSVH
ncbi:hypothetical protein CDR19_25340 [Ectopseudomonas toyotomiensis]|uniref:Uncharacterized protein n=1 Tax=Ectopseudomonas toyotomiensis TaxID=554344 RepID=A0A1I5Z5Y2_9GAMM|nr:hypothetical protein [Pseudomonas toyotomiensis]PIA66344.1 hypothetical protein CDR19_25340 [Pseudomonas toyotomiensis]SFQ51874.1 hypothetical protein SAMN05216177_1288 [Pseudomonas toyotomiensis]